jgi:serine/threonine protein kinase
LKNFLHRDIKPENFTVGPGKNSKIIYLIDFGLSKTFLDEKGKHIPFRDKKGMVGTARYGIFNNNIVSNYNIFTLICFIVI